MIGKDQESIRGQHLILFFGEMLQEITEEICQERLLEEEQVLDQKDKRVQEDMDKVIDQEAEEVISKKEDWKRD